MMHDEAIDAAYDALRHQTQTVSDGGHPTIEGMRRAIAAFLRQLHVEILNGYHHDADAEYAERLCQTADELEAAQGQSERG